MKPMEAKHRRARTGAGRKTAGGAGGRERKTFVGERFARDRKNRRGVAM